MTLPLDNIISADNEVFRTYLFWTAFLVFKTLLMAPLTATQRQKYKAAASKEDLKLGTGLTLKVSEHVERVRRAHRNDMENNYIMMIIGFGYVLTSPDAFIATMIFRISALCRLLHTIVYTQYVLPQPSRAIAFFVPLFTTGYMAYKSIQYYC